MLSMSIVARRRSKLLMEDTRVLNTLAAQKLLAFIRGYVVTIFSYLLNMQGDHLPGKPVNVREFETCQGNIRDVVNSLGIVREMSWKKILSWNSVPKLFITR